MGELILNLTNCESSITEHFLFEDDLVIENFVYSDGEITSCTFKIWSSSEYMGDTYDLIEMGMLSEDKKSITFDFQLFNNAYQSGKRDASWWNGWDYNQYTITATAEDGVITPDLPDIVLEGANYSINDITGIDWNVDRIITLQADEGYYFTTPMTVRFIGNDNWRYLNDYLNEDRTIISFSTFDYFNENIKYMSKDFLNEYSLENPTVFSLKTVKGKPPYTPSETEINYFMDNASSDRVERIDVWEGSFTITADEGFIIDTAFFKFWVYQGGSIDYDLMKMGYITEDKKSLVIDLEDFSDRLNSDGRGQSWRDLIDYQEIHVTTIEEGFTDEFFNANDYLKTYVIEDKFLLDLSMLIFMGEGAEGLVNTINKIYSIPFNIDEELINTFERDVYLGNVHTDIKGKLLKTSSLKYDLGNIHVPAVYNNVYDYKDTECIVHIPFSEPIKVDVYKVIDCIVNCTLYVDVYTGSGTVIITSSNINGEIVNKVNVTVGYETPIFNQQGVIGNLKDYEFNTDYTFKIEVNRNIPVNVEKNNIIEYGKVSDYENLVIVDDLKMNSISTIREKEEIKNLLNQGIFIK